MKRLIIKFIENRFYTYLVILAIFIFGIIAYKSIGIDFFPDAERPGVVVMVQAPGMSATDIERDISRPLERVFYSIDSVRKVSSINRDSMAIVSIEFNYSKALDTALLEVSNIINNVELPSTAKTPVLFKTGEFTQPIMTLAITSKDQNLPLSMVRQIAENDLKDRLLTIKDVASVEVFGGQRREVRVEIDIKRMIQHGLTPSDLTKALGANNVSLPAGININNEKNILLQVNTEAEMVSEIEEIPIVTRNGVIPLRDIANISITTSDRHSSFYFNNQKAVAVNILRNQHANTLETIMEVKKALPKIKREFPGLDITVADSQERVIRLSITNLKSSLFIAITLTVVILFFVIGDLRISLVVAISLPLTFLLSFIAMWALQMRFNLITMSAIIISSGMLIDNTIVVSENIQRHLVLKRNSIYQAISEGTSEVMISIFSGTFSTILVLIPVMFLGGYVEKILQPLATTLIITLIVSYIVAIWFVPILYLWISGIVSKIGFIERGADKIAGFSQRYLINSTKNFFVGFFSLVNRYRILVVPVLILFLFSIILMDKLVGRDLMSPMDTGIILIDVRLSPEFSVERSEKVLEDINTKVLSKYKDITISLLGYIGSEPGLISFGKGRTQSDISITLTLVDRFHRDRTIWQIEEEIRRGLYEVEGVVGATVKEYGATPLSSIAAPLDVQIAGQDFRELDQVATVIEQKLSQTTGFTSVSRNWYVDKKDYILRLNKQKTAYYGITPMDVSYYLSQMLGGSSGGLFRLEAQDGLNIRLLASDSIRGNIENIETLPIPTPKGYIHLKEIADIEPSFIPQIYSRDNLKRTVHVYGYKSTAPTSFLDRQRDRILKEIELPEGISISKEGEIKQMTESFKRLGEALLFSVILLFLTFVIIFRSFSDSFIIMFAIPLSFIGAVWGLLIAGKHGSMPAFMGFLLLIGVIVNNSILLVDFIKRLRHRHKDTSVAVYEAVKLRVRPVIATATTTIAGMLPIAAERAFGLERLSPLAIVAVGGLFIGTFLTLVYTPVFYLLKEWAFETFLDRKRKIVNKMRQKPIA